MSFLFSFEQFLGSCAEILIQQRARKSEGISLKLRQEFCVASAQVSGAEHVKNYPIYNKDFLLLIRDWLNIVKGKYV